MQYIFDPSSGDKTLQLDGDIYRYLVKVRRYKEGDEVYFRNLQDDILYRYIVSKIDKKHIDVLLHSKELSIVRSSKKLHIFWCVIDPQVVYKTIPALNQIGVSKITFIYCDRSQKNFKLDIQKLKTISINSNQQSGRVDLMEFEISNSLEDILDIHGDITVLDFGGSSKFSYSEKVLIGCEGGFTNKERSLMKNHSKISFQTNNILKSETATISIASRLLL
jgi:16S rRNA (uracil1498-N3)-methyltransferase